MKPSGIDSIVNRCKPKSAYEKFRLSWGHDERSLWVKLPLLALLFALFTGLPIYLLLTFDPRAVLLGAAVLLVMFSSLWVEYSDKRNGFYLLMQIVSGIGFTVVGVWLLYLLYRSFTES